MIKNILVISTIILFVLIACNGSKKAVSKKNVKSLDCNSSSLSLVKDIKPILETSCASYYSDGLGGCHASDYSKGFNFGQSFASTIKSAAMDGKLLGAINHTNGFAKMPQGGIKLDQETINKIECWINNGMKD